MDIVERLRLGAAICANDGKAHHALLINEGAETILSLREQLQAVEGALSLLEQAATEVHRRGAVAGAQWPKLAGALVRARAWTDTTRAAHQGAGEP